MNYRNTKITVLSWLLFSSSIFSMQEDDGSAFNWPTTVINNNCHKVKIRYYDRKKENPLVSVELKGNNSTTFLCATVYDLEFITDIPEEYEHPNRMPNKFLDITTKTVTIHPSNKEGAVTVNIESYRKPSSDFLNPQRSEQSSPTKPNSPISLPSNGKDSIN